MHDGSSSAGRERPSSMQGMDMASLPPRKRPWQDGPGTGEHDSAGPEGGERAHVCAHRKFHAFSLMSLNLNHLYLKVKVKDQGNSQYFCF